MQNLHEVNAVGKKKEKFFQKKPEEKKKSANGSTQQIDWKFCGKKHTRPACTKCLAYGQQCNRCGKSNHFAAKCTGGKQFSCNLHVNQNMNYVQEDSDESQFEEYTITSNS